MSQVLLFWFMIATPAPIIGCVDLTVTLLGIVTVSDESC